MRSHVLNGYQTARPRSYRGTALVNGSGEGIDLAAIAGIIAAIGPVLDDIGQWFQFGGGYTAENGGEVRRQLEGLGDLGKPYANPYMYYLKTYDQPTWNSGDIWNAPGYSQRSRFKDAYEILLAAGMPAGTLLGRDMRPLGLTQAVAAAEAQQAVTAGPVAPNAQQMGALQILAMQLAGLGTPADAAAAAVTVAALPNGWRTYVNQLVALWQAANDQTPPAPGPGPGPSPGTDTDTGFDLKKAAPLLIGVGAVLLLTR